ncbi:tryptophan-rich sensory protein [Agromyces mariniharenae]|uniref:Tryptophan-rich sensory protein n=1 Tax=Agromyces mariniharenae TaxID=2604423 RepID=A0A5S4V7D3_9MICO|nr:tryptophan-rich sensory protein [Agromyces mariniharenae]TYL53969.1 tryptophan-rich sensory protein [Agromyces mariniharenae]
MTTTSTAATTTRGGDLARQLTVAVSALLAVIGSFIGSGAAGGTPVQDAAGGALAADATLIAPGTGAFSIWSLIYSGLLAYAVWQFLPAQRIAERHRRIGYLVAASLLLNAAWILSIQFDLLRLSVPIIGALLVVLIAAFRRCLALPPRNALDALATDGTVGLYLGWVTVATAANVTAALVAAGFDGWGIPPETWAVVVVAVAGLVGVALAVWDRGRIAPTLSLAWGLSWIAIARLTDTPESTVTGIAAIIAAVAVVLTTVVARLAVELRRRRAPRSS